MSPFALSKINAKAKRLNKKPSAVSDILIKNPKKSLFLNRSEKTHLDLTSEKRIIFQIIKSLGPPENTHGSDI